MEHKDSVENTTGPTPCARGCGFYGTSATANMCSKCFREKQREEEEQAKAASMVSNAVSASQASSTASISSKDASDTLNTLVKGQVSRPNTPVLPTSVPASSTTATVVASMTTPLFTPQPVAARIPSPVAPSSPVSRPKSPRNEDESATQVDEAALPPRKIQKNPNRCWMCRKKVGLTGFKCRCDYIFCGEHRYSDKHECDFDYKKTEREQLSKANPVVMASKLTKI